MTLTLRAIKLKFVTRELPGARAVAAIDTNGRVLVLIDADLPRRGQVANTFWGILQYLRLRFLFLGFCRKNEDPVESLVRPTREMNSTMEALVGGQRKQ